MPSSRIREFDLWRPGYGLASVTTVLANTSTPASIFYDEALTLAAPNPQTLLEKTTGDGISYGKWAAPLYVGVPYQLQVNNIDETGIERPALITLDGADASKALVTVTGGNVPTKLSDELARRIDVRDYGIFLAVGVGGASASTNNATLVAALGVAAAAGAGYVDVPAGTYQVTFFTVPQGVIIRGVGRGATILQSTVAGNVATIGGVRAGFSRITLDGVTLVAGSVGVYAANVDQIVFDDAEVKRFETGIWRKGGKLCNWRDLYVSTCVNGYKCHGDSALGAGGEIILNRWIGGKIELCTTLGLELKNVDSECGRNTFVGIDFDTNTGTAISIVGARSSRFVDCLLTGNTADLTVADATPATASNTVIGLIFDGGRIVGGSLSFANTIANVQFIQVLLDTAAVTINTNQNNILALDCRENAMTFAGTISGWTRRQAVFDGATFTTTTDAITKTAWRRLLTPGEQVFLLIKVVARRINALDFAYWCFAIPARNGASLLNYVTDTGAFTAGQIVTGALSGATGRIAAVTAIVGNAGTLNLYDVNGIFISGELLTDPLGGSAHANGSQAAQSVTVLAGNNLSTTINTVGPNWTLTFAGVGQEVQIVVGGAAATTVEWTVDVDVSSSQVPS